MEAGRARYRDNPGLPTLSLGLTSVRHIVTKLETECARVVAINAFKSEIIKDEPCSDNSNDYYDFSFDPKVHPLNRFVVNLGVTLSKCIPSVTLANFGFLAVTTGLFAPRMISYLVVYPFCRLVFGTLYPAYASYKAVRTKNLKEYVKWMMYWIVFALFTCTETFTDVFLSWFPFYYEVKIVLVLWLLSPATKGSSILYRKFVHPALCRREQEIDEYIAKAKDQGYHTVLNLGTKGVNYATTVIMQTAIKNLNLPSPEQGKEVRRAIQDRDVTDGYHDYEEMEFQRSDNMSGIVEIVELDQDNDENLPIGDGDANDPDYEPELSSARSRGNVVRKRKTTKDKEKRPRSSSRGRRTRSQAALQNKREGGGGLVQQLRKSYSLSDLSECEPREERGDEADDVLTEPRLVRRAVKSGFTTRRSASESNSRSPMYFPEVDVDVRPRPRMDEPDFSHIKSTEDISSGYSSAENSSSLTRTASAGGAARRARASRTAVTAVRRPPAAEDNQVLIEELHDDDSFDYTNMPPLVNFSSPLLLSHTDPPFIYQYVGDRVKIIQVLGNYPLSNNPNNNNKYSDQRDQKEASVETHTSPITKYPENEYNDKSKLEEATVNKDLNTDIPIDTDTEDNNGDNMKCKVSELFNKQEKNLKSESYFMHDIGDPCKSKDTVSEELTDSSFFEPLSNDDDYVGSDDEASFETPISTPKSIRKNIKGKYGKNKAPSPPKVSTCEDEELESTNINEQCSTSVDNLISNKTNNIEEIDALENDQNPITEVLDNCKQSQGSPFQCNASFDVNSEPDKENNEPSNSSPKIFKGNLTFGKLFNIPSKLVFWHKTDDKSIVNVYSSNASRKSSVENTFDEFQSCSDLNVYTYQHDIPQIKITEIPVEDNVSGENISSDILKKSDALQKIINEKLENHPEYKFVSLHEEIPTTSKSTDV
ncbi:unnamed protein product [Euphydryas editha]|uniref:Receptor expression-enhancing protein 1 n=1 Tax=Euphydryas editha TaxID=104508 RepID=A0AAU9TJI9_EUPED|nr:unnamed protein product [Euphydryas editha]